MIWFWVVRSTSTSEVIEKRLLSREWDIPHVRTVGIAEPWWLKSWPGWCRRWLGRTRRLDPRLLLCTVTLYANQAYNLTRSLTSLTIPGLTANLLLLLHHASYLLLRFQAHRALALRPQLLSEGAVIRVRVSDPQVRPPREPLADLDEIKGGEER